MSVTNYMFLTLPTPTVTLGPEWATDLNTAFTVVDYHNHTSGQGAQIPTSGLNLNANLSFNSFRATFLEALQLVSGSSALTGVTNASLIQVVNGDLYYTNGSGVSVQITSGGSVVTTPASVNTFQFDSFNTDLVIGASDVFVVIAMNTSAARLITLPLASAVPAGRFYIISDISGASETNNITITASGSDTILGAASLVVNSNYGSYQLVSDGVSNWVTV